MSYKLAEHIGFVQNCAFNKYQKVFNKDFIKLNIHHSYESNCIQFLLISRVSDKLIFNDVFQAPPYMFQIKHNNIRQNLQFISNQIQYKMSKLIKITNICKNLIDRKFSEDQIRSMLNGNYALDILIRSLRIQDLKPEYSDDLLKFVISYCYDEINFSEQQMLKDYSIKKLQD